MHILKFLFLYSPVNVSNNLILVYQPHEQKETDDTQNNQLSEKKKKQNTNPDFSIRKENEQLVLEMCCSLNSQSLHVPLGCREGPEPTSCGSRGALGPTSCPCL